MKDSKQFYLDSKIKITYLYRCKKQKLFSIERVFHSLIHYIKEKAFVSEVYLPYFKARPDVILRNLFFSKKIEGDIIHITGDVYYVAMITPPNKTIVTVHDLVSLKNSSGIKKALIKLVWYTLPLMRCKYITVISPKTKKELLSIFPKLENKIYVIENPVSDEFYFHPKEFNKSHPIILQIGTKNNKNIIRLAEALEGIDCELRIVGNLNEQQILALDKHAISYTNIFHVSDSEIVNQYCECDMLTFVSTYEGFGVPIIEAQTVGRPVITSNIEPMKSVAGNGAILVDPTNTNDIKEGIKKIIINDKLREKIIFFGKKNAEMYSAKIIANKYYQLYRKILESKEM